MAMAASGRTTELKAHIRSQLTTSGSMGSAMAAFTQQW